MRAFFLFPLILFSLLTGCAAIRPQTAVEISALRHTTSAAEAYMQSYCTMEFAVTLEAARAAEATLDGFAEAIADRNNGLVAFQGLVRTARLAIDAAEAALQSGGVTEVEALSGPRFMVATLVRIVNGLGAKLLAPDEKDPSLSDEVKLLKDQKLPLR